MYLKNTDQSGLKKMVDTSDEWIITRTGIRERRIAKRTESTSDLATKAALNALDSAGVKPEARLYYCSDSYARI